MERLIGDLLDVSAIEAGQLAIQHSRVSPGELLVETLELQQPIAAAGSLEIRLELDSELPDVWGDRYRLLQVLENLIGNATKFTPPSGRITIGAAPRDRDVLFWVTDSGCGISPEHLPHIFDRFWQASRGDRRGTGLGLSITRGIVDAHGGQFWAESTVGRGTTFFFTIPQAPLVGAAGPEAPPPGP
jgi:signal transduction histidine kinase